MVLSSGSSIVAICVCLIERYHQGYLRTILNIHWSDFVTNIEVLEMAMVTSIAAMLLKIQLRWAGHVSRMEDYRLPKVILYGELSTGHRDKGAPQKIYKDTLKRSLGCNSATSIIPSVDNTSIQSKELAIPSPNMEDKRRRRINRDRSEINTGQIVTCSRCGKACLSRIGFISRQRVCTRRVYILYLRSRSRAMIVRLINPRIWFPFAAAIPHCSHISTNS